MSKDRAAPFSRKHRKYWIPVTGGMILIGLINVAIGFCGYEKPPVPERMELVIPSRDAAVLPIDAGGTLGPGELPAVVMRAFAARYKQTIPTGAVMDGENYRINLPPGRGHNSITLAPDGTFVRED